MRRCGHLEVVLTRGHVRVVLVVELSFLLVFCVRKRYHLVFDFRARLERIVDKRFFPFNFLVGVVGLGDQGQVVLEQLDVLGVLFAFVGLSAAEDLSEDCEEDHDQEDDEKERPRRDE